MSVAHVLLYLLLGDVGTSVFNSNSRLEVVEMPTIKLEKFQQQTSQIQTLVTEDISFGIQFLMQLKGNSEIIL